jgi:hypothetical protein
LVTTSSFFAFFLSQIGEQLLGPMTAAAVKASAKHSDDLDYVLGRFFLEARWFAFVDDDDLDVLNLAQGKDQF